MRGDRNWRDDDQVANRAGEHRYTGELKIAIKHSITRLCIHILIVYYWNFSFILNHALT